MAADLHRADDAAFVNGIDADCVRPEVADVELGIVGGDDATHRAVADEVGAANLVGTGFDDGEAIAIEVADEQLTAIRLQRKLYWQLAYVKQRQQPVGFQVDGRKLVRPRTRDKGFAVIGKNDNVLGLLTDGDSAAYRKLLRVKNRHGIVGAVADDHDLPIRRNFRQAGRAADPNGRYYRAFGKVNDRDIGGAGVGHVGALSIRGDRNKIWGTMHANGIDYFIAFGINDADLIGLGIGNIDLVAFGISSGAGRARADGYGLDILELQQVENADRVTLPVGNVGIFVVSGIDGWALTARWRAHRQQQSTKRDSLRASYFGHQRATLVLKRIQFAEVTLVITGRQPIPRPPGPGWAGGPPD